MPFAVIEVQVTPNPNALKFILDGQISGQPISFFDAQAAQNHPLAARLFAIKGVTCVLILGDFVTVNKSSQAKWAEIRKEIEQVLKTA